MNDYMLGMARMRGKEMMREARRDRLAAEVRRTARSARGPVIRVPHRLAVAARLRPTATGR
jgi:hypothetical protein